MASRNTRLANFRLSDPNYLAAQNIMDLGSTDDPRAGWVGLISKILRGKMAGDARREGRAAFDAQEAERAKGLNRTIGLLFPQETISQTVMPKTQQPDLARNIDSPNFSEPEIKTSIMNSPEGSILRSMIGNPQTNDLGESVLSNVLANRFAPDLAKNTTAQQKNYRELQKLQTQFPPVLNPETKKMEDSAEVKAFKNIIRPPSVINLGSEFRTLDPLSGRTTGSYPVKLKPSEDPKYKAQLEKQDLKLKGFTKRAEGRLEEGKEAAKGLPIIDRSIALLNEIPTGGFNLVALKATNIFGVTGADVGELSQNLGKAVLAQLRNTFGAAFTEKEGKKLEDIEASFGKSPEANKRILINLKSFLEVYYKQGLEAAEDLGDEAARSSLEEIRGTQLGGMNKRKEALEWIKENPNDERVPAIKARLGIKQNG